MTARLLIVEDNATNMELMAYLLGAFGYVVDSAPDGEAGIEMALRLAPDLIICDLEMPGRNGFDVVRELREHTITRHIPILAVTAYAMVGDRERVLAAGFDGYISKPVNPETFTQEIEAFLPANKRSVQRPVTHDGAADSEMPPRNAGALVLAVDDSPVNLALIKSTLEPVGYRLITTGSVTAACQLLRHYAFDLILSDLHMSPESGLEFLTFVKADLATRSIPFILCTSSRTGPTDNIAQRALSLGADRFLTRPIVPERLIEEVAACLKRWSTLASEKRPLMRQRE